MRALSLALLLCTGLAPLVSQTPNAAVKPATSAATSAAPGVKPALPQGPFNPKANSFRDLKAAKAEAKRSGRRIILDVGGNWCPWCHKLHAFWAAQPEVKALRDQGFVFLLVNFSKDMKNEKFLAQYPKVPGYPHLFVLDADGKLLHSQDTGVLEQDGGYSAEKIGAFLKAWKP